MIILRNISFQQSYYIPQILYDFSVISIRFIYEVYEMLGGYLH